MTQTTMTQSSSFAEEAVARILELSADLQIRRRATERWSLAYYDLSVAITAYGKVLEVLTALKRTQEENRVSLALLRSLEWSPEPRVVA